MQDVCDASCMRNELFCIRRISQSGSVRVVASYSDSSKPLTIASEADAHEMAENMAWKAVRTGSLAAYEVFSELTGVVRQMPTPQS